MNIKTWTSPITKQWPIFLSWIILVGWFSILHYPIPRWPIICLHAYLAALLAFKKPLKVLVYFTAFSLYALQAFLVWAYKLSISPTVLTLVAETSPRESCEFFSQVLTMPAFWKTLGFGLFLLCLVVLAEKNREKVTRILAKMRWLSVIFAIMIIGGIAYSYIYVSLFQCKNLDDVAAWSNNDHYPNDNMTRMIVTLYDIYLSQEEMKDVMEVVQNTERVVPTSQDSVNIILVIGESYIRQHTPIYGYPLQTTPFMSHEQQEGRLIAFTDAVSPYKFTTEVVRNMISCNSLGNGEKWSQKPPLTAVFRRAGFYVSMYDNQRTYGQSNTFAFALNTYLFHPQVIEVCYDEVNEESFDYDLQIVDEYANKDREPVPHELTVFHLMGQHFEAVRRYPSEYSYFTADSLAWRKEDWLSQNKRQLIAEYDNATRYNDLVIQRITELFQDKATILIYVSDHGEEIYDYRDIQGRVGGDDLCKELEYQYAVPMVVWWNDRYSYKHPDIVESLQKAKNRPFMISDIYQMLFHIGGLTQSSYYQACNDVLNDDYKCSPRIVGEQWNYDEIIGKNDGMAKE